MSRKKELDKTIEKLQKLSEQELKEVNDFVDFLIHKIKDRDLTYSIQSLAAKSKTFQFLEEEEELYSEEDLKDHF